MSITMRDGIGYATRSKAAISFAGATTPDGKQFTTPKEKSHFSSNPWADWGDDNLLPVSMSKDIGECGVLSAGLDMKARIAIGRGVLPFFLLNVDREGKEDLEFVNDSEILDWFELNDSFGYSINSLYDKYSYGWTPTQLMLSRNRQKINRIRRTDVVTTRLQKRSAIGHSENLYICHDWEENPSANSEYVKTVPILKEGNELQDLEERTSGFEFAVINRQLRNGRGYYVDPLWYSAKKWVDHAKSIPALKNAMMKNSITVKYLVTISAGYWRRVHKQWDSFTPEKRNEIIEKKLEEIDKYLVGIENQFKSLFTMSYIDPVTKQEIPDIKIEVLDDKVKDGKLLPDSAAANSEILFALQVNPAMVGAGQPGGAYANNAGGSNIRESYLTSLMTLEWERRDNARIFSIVKNKNGWAQRLEVERPMVSMSTAGSAITNTEKKIKPRLVFRYPSGLLTTLDTGKSTKGEVL